MAELFSGAGYQTRMFGMWHIGDVQEDRRVSEDVNSRAANQFGHTGPIPAAKVYGEHDLNSRSS